MEKAFITGLEGFTGRYLAREMHTAGYAVSGTELVKSADADPGVFQCDLCDVDALKRVVAEVKPDVVAHLAGIAFVPHGNADAMYRTNLVGTRNLLEAIASSGHRPRAILLASSSNIYGNAAVEVIEETVLPAPTNDYAVSKLAMEYMARLWIDRLPIIFVRPFNYTGIGQSLVFLLPKIVDHFRRRAPVIELGNLDVVRDFSDVRILVQVYRRLLQLASEEIPRGEAFNTCSGKGHSLLSVIQMMQEISGYSIEVRVNPEFVRDNEVKILLGSRAKLEKIIGAVEDIPLIETLRWMYQGGGAAQA